MIPDAKIYIIEDDSTMIDLLRTLLEMEGFRVFTYDHKSGASIPKKVASVKPALILMDVNMQDLDGLEILQQIKTNLKLAKIKIIMSSGADYRDLCLRYGADEFLLKPYMPDDLIRMIRDVLAEKDIR